MKSQGIYQPGEVSHALDVTGEQGPTGILLDWVRGWDQDTRQLMLYQAAKCSKGIIISLILRYKAYRNHFVQCTRLLSGTKVLLYHLYSGIRHVGITLYSVPDCQVFQRYYYITYTQL